MRSRALLAVSALLFLGWVAYLAVLALTAREPVVLSRPQLLAADLIVTAEVEALDRPVTVVEVHHAQGAAPEKGGKVEVANLPDSKAGWVGPGRYLLPLTAKEGHRLTAVPRSPGYGGGPPRIYPVTASTETQLRQVLGNQGE